MKVLHIFYMKVVWGKKHLDFLYKFKSLSDIHPCVGRSAIVQFCDLIFLKMKCTSQQENETVLVVSEHILTSLPSLQISNGLDAERCRVGSTSVDFRGCLAAAEGVICGFTVTGCE